MKRFNEGVYTGSPKVNLSCFREFDELERCLRYSDLKHVLRLALFLFLLSLLSKSIFGSEKLFFCAMAKSTTGRRVGRMPAVAAGVPSVAPAYCRVRVFQIVNVVTEQSYTLKAYTTQCILRSCLGKRVQIFH